MLHFRSSNGAIGDAIPFFHKGEYHLFYLRAKPVEDFEQRACTPWGHIVSKDLLSWTELPIAILPSDEEDAPDHAACWTGSVIEHNGTFHMYYTGGKFAKPLFMQSICHATSSDLVSWQKDEQNPIITPDPSWYEDGDWRDPFVYWNERDRRFEMLIAARNKNGWLPRRGCLAVATSFDLKDWSVKSPVWEPYVTHVLECPERFRIGSQEYLAYSTYSEDNVTHYRLIDGEGRFHSPGSNDAIDGRFYYAAKGLYDGKDRITFGWIPEVTGMKDEGQVMWAGDLGIPHVLKARKDGSLKVYYPEIYRKAFTRKIDFKKVAIHGDVKAAKDQFSLRSDHGTSLILFEPQPQIFYMRFSLAMKKTTESSGLILNGDRDLDHGYFLEFVNASRCLRLFKYPIGDRQRKRKILVQRTMPFDVRGVVVEVFYEKGLMTVFVNESACLTARMYDTGDLFGFFVQSGSATCRKIAISLPSIDGKS